MQVSVSKKEFLRLLGRCQGVADKKSTMPVLGNVLLTTEGEALRVSATDLYLSVSGTVSAEVTAGGSIAVGARDLFERVKMMPDGKVTISTTDGSSTTLRAAGQPRRYTLHGVPGDEFPALPQPDASNEASSVKVEVLAQLIAATHFSISTDETRLHLNSALFEWVGGSVSMVTTDGHRLSKMKIAATKQKTPISMLIPMKAIAELKRLCEEARAEGIKEIQLNHTGPDAFFRVGNVQFGVKLVDAQFPPYQQVIPSSTTNEIRAPRAAVADALRAVSIAASDRTGGVKVNLDKDVIRFVSESPESGDGFDEVPVEYTGKPLTVGFNARYFLDVLGAIEDDELTLGISGELDPALIKPAKEPAGSEYLAVIMPMRI
jgi:DNA polymerase III subunit beta